MKYWVWVVVVAVLTFLAMEYLMIPLWMVLVIGLPVLAVVLVIVSVLYNFRQSLKMNNIPAHGYGSRIKDLDREAGKVYGLGFKKIDQFYLKTIPDSVTYVFQHEKEPFSLCIYHMGQKMVCDMLTRFENDYHLTTTDSVDAGMAPRPKKSLMQIFPRQPYATLVQQHRQALAYVENSGIRVYDIPQLEFRRYFMTSYRTHADYMKKLFLWPIALIIRTLTKPGRIYCRSITEQFPEGIPSFQENQ